MEYLIEKYNDISVYWTLDLDGGGRSFGQQFVPVVRDMLGRQERIFEFCSGPGFIGFSLLAHGLCDTLCLADVNPAAVDVVRKTIQENGLEDRVTVYVSDCLNGIPDHERWDLVVGNPPHFLVSGDLQESPDLIQFDPGWRIHEAFYEQIHKFLKPHASIILQENYSGSNEATFDPFLEKGGLEFVKSFMYCEHEPRLDAHYFYWTRQVHPDVADGDKQITDIKLTASKLRDEPVARNFDRLAKVRFEIANDMDHEAKIGFQIHSYAIDRVIAVPPGTTKTTGIMLMPAGVLYMIDVTGRSHTTCTWC